MYECCLQFSMILKNGQINGYFLILNIYFSILTKFSIRSYEKRIDFIKSSVKEIKKNAIYYK